MATHTTYVGNSNGDMRIILTPKILINTQELKSQKILHKSLLSSGQPIKTLSTESSLP